MKPRVFNVIIGKYGIELPTGNTKPTDMVVTISPILSELRGVRNAYAELMLEVQDYAIEEASVAVALAAENSRQALTKLDNLISELEGE